jgi:hypothetical protein
MSVSIGEVFRKAAALPADSDHIVLVPCTVKWIMRWEEKATGEEEEFKGRADGRLFYVPKKAALPPKLYGVLLDRDGVSARGGGKDFLGVLTVEVGIPDNSSSRVSLSDSTGHGPPVVGSASSGDLPVVVNYPSYLERQHNDELWVCLLPNAELEFGEPERILHLEVAYPRLIPSPLHRF